MAITDKHLSIILTAFNEEKTVRRCIESVIAQENADLQMECVIVDDCSTDGTLDAIRTIVRAYTGAITFRMFRHKTHRGLSVVRNTGLQQAQGGYVMFINASDYLAPDCIDYYTENLMRYWDMDVIVGNVHNNRTQQTLLHDLTGPVVVRGDGNAVCQQMMAHDLYLFAWNKLVRRDLLLQKGIVFDESLYYADAYWAAQLFRRTSSVLLLPNLTYIYEGHSDVGIWAAEKRANALVHSYVVTADRLLDHAPRPHQSTADGDHYSAYQLFVFSLLMSGEDVEKEYDITSQVRRELSNVRKRIVTQTRNDAQKTLALYFSSAGSALGSLVRLPVFKRYDRMVEHIVKVMQSNMK